MKGIGYMVSIDKWNLILEDLHKQYITALPFPHIILDHFLPEAEADKMADHFPDIVDKRGWIHYRHYNENTHGLNEFSRLPAPIAHFIEEMHSAPLVTFLENLTEIGNLLVDNTLEGAGLHLSERGGHLNIHADFATHPRFNHLQRRLNVLFYLNKNWQKEYGGDLEFWSSDMNRCEKKIAPVFNRLVVFSTNAFSYHGFPEPVLCPEGEGRKSVALYYYTHTESANSVLSTNYKLRPGEGWKALPNWIDNQLLFGYTYLKGFLHLNDRWTGNLLGIKDMIDKRKGRNKK